MRLTCRAVYARVGATANNPSLEATGEWNAFARHNAWTDVADRNVSCSVLLKHAEAVA